MRRVTLFLLFAVWGGLMFGQTGLDCSDAIPVPTLDNSGSCDVISGDNTGAVSWEVDPGSGLFFSGGCWGGATPPVFFYSFTAQGVSGSIEVSNGPVGEDPLVSVITFPNVGCDGLDFQEVGCSDDGTPIDFDNQLVIGQDYYVVVAFTNDAEGTFDLCVFNPEPADNDECADAIQLSDLDGGCNGGYSNYYPSSEGVVPACFGTNTYTVWFYFTAQGVSIADLHIDGNSEDANVAIWDFSGGGSCADLGAATLLACETDVDQNNPIVLDNQLDIGGDYWISVSFNNNSTDEDFQVCLDNPEPAVNDECLDALEYPDNELAEMNCLTVIGADQVSNDYPSSDVLVPFCWDPDFSYSVWFSFIAQGPDVDIEVDLPGATEQIALIDFTGNPCELAGASVVECIVGDDLEFDNDLVIGHLYYVVVGFEDNVYGDFCINIFNPIPPDNDTVCAAIPLPTDGSCNAGPPCINDCYTTEYANPEFNPLNFPGDCQPYVENTVWFTAELDDVNNVGFEINVEEGTGSDFTVVVGTFDDCNGTFFVEDFFCDFDYPIEFGPVDEDETYYIMVGSSEMDAGTFTICVDEIPPCFDNNFCDDPLGVSSANEIVGVVSNGPFVCFEGCNQYADPLEPGVGDACDMTANPVVWYTITTDDLATLMNIQITSDEVSAPSVQIYTGPDCGSLNAVPQTSSNLLCVVGSGGEVIANGTTVSNNQTYYIAVSGVNTVGGTFELCINTVEQATECVLDADIEITDRSFGGPLEGPFFPGETVSVCMNVNSYTAAGNGCQWFQGIVPVFGNGWDPGSFDGQGQPNNATLNGNAYPTGGVLNASTWDWWEDVTYHHDNLYFQVGDFDGNGTLDMCNSLYDPDCVGPGILGGSAPPCWDINPGSLLPPGWFAWGVTGLCPTDGYPGVDWGDGAGCGLQGGSWSFCFDLDVRDAPDCETDETYSDLTLTFFSFADGEVGSWNGGPSVCALDEPFFLTPPMCCVEVVNAGENLDPICTDGIFNYTLDWANFPGAAEVDFWEWTVSIGPGIVGPQDGQGPNGTTVISTIENTGTDMELVTYNFLGFAGGECPAIILEVNIEVYPELMVTMDPFTVCATPNNPYTIIPNVMGGQPGTYQYEWHDGSSEDQYEVAAPVPGATYVVTVTDDVGCSGTASVVLDVYETFPVEIDAPITEQCASDGTIDFSASASDGMPAYSFEWTSPGGSNASGPNITTDEGGQWNVVVTDSEGCMGEDSVQIEFWESPNVEVFPDQIAVCLDVPNAQQIQALVNGGQNPYEYEWTTPSQTFTTSFILADEIGTYNILVTDANGCTTELTFDVDEAPSPSINLPGLVELCEEELTSVGYEIDVPFDPTFVFYEWPDGSSASSWTVYEPGVYEVTVTNEYGCDGTDAIIVEVFDSIQTGLPDSISFCTGGFAILEADPQYDYEWSTGGSGDIVFIFNPDLVFVTVTDANGCTIEDEVEVIESDFLVPDLIADSVICNGVPVDILANSGFATYEWSNGEMDVESIVATSGGWYWVEVSDGDGCFGRDSVLVVESAPDPAIQGTPAICDGESSTLDVGAWNDIMWSTGATTSTIVTDTGGTFMVTVTDVYGCQNTTSYDVVESVSPDPQIAGSTSFCVGSSTQLDAGGPFDTYEWSTGESTQTITVNSTSTLYLTVTNSAGCEGYDTISVVEATALSPNILGDTIVCNSVAVTLDAGGGFVSYEWSTTANSQTIDVDQAGTYYVTVTDADGCTGTDEVIVNAGDPMPTIDGAAEVCQGGTEMLTVPGTYDSYEWSTTENGQSISVGTGGMYFVTVTDQYGCTGEASFDFTVNPNPTPAITGSTTFCSGGFTLLDAGAYASYAWSTGESSQEIQVSTTGTVVVTVTDAEGCTGTAEVSVMESDQLQLNVQDTVMCEGEVVTLSVGTFDTYDWSTTETSPTIDVTNGGVYSVTVSDGQGCTGEASITVTENPQPFAVVTPDAAACNTAVDGSTIDFSTLVTGGDTGGTWTDLDASGAAGAFPVLDFDGVTIGQYRFEYTTASAVAPCNDVSYIVTITIQDCTCPSPDITAPAPLCADAGALDLTSLYITGVTQTGGQWSIITTPGGSNPAVLNGTTFDASGADPGLYEIQYTLSGLPVGCIDNAVQQLMVNAPADAGFADQPAQICVGEDSTIALRNLVVGGEPTGTWVETSTTPSVAGFNAATGEFNTALELPGVYTFEFIVAGTMPCPDASTTVEVVVENVPDADAGIDGKLTCDITSVELGGNGSSQGTEFRYLWTTTDGEVVDTTSLFTTVKVAGTYTLMVENVNTGCRSFDDVVVVVEGDIPTDVVYDLRFPICDGDPPASLNVQTITGGTAPYQYSLNGAAPTTDPIFQNLAPGSYTLAIEDALGCTIERDFIIPEINLLDGVIDGGDITVSLGKEVILGYILSLGIADSVIWMDEDGMVICAQCDSLAISPTGNTQILLTIFNAEGCSITLATNLRVIVDRELFVPNVFSPNDDGSNDFVTVHGQQDLFIKNFEVFSRWGELVFKRTEFPANDPQLGWDGKMAGEEMLPGVYVFHAQVVYPDGYEETIKGDITLIR